MRAPPRISALIGRYRSDGGFAPGLNGKMVGAWGAAWWAPGTPPQSPPTAFASGLCPDPSSNNIAELFGFRACLRRAIRHPVRTPLVFELDSMLVVQCINGDWGCHRAHLRILLMECYDLGEGLAYRGYSWSVRHIYREYNTVADRLAGEAIRHGHGVESLHWPIEAPDSETDSDWYSPTASTTASGSEPSAESTASS